MIIGLSGYAQSGKDTLAKVLVEEHGYIRVAFADKIREFLYEMNPLTEVIGFEPIYLKERVDRDGWEKAKQNPHIRRILQNAGVAARKTFGANHWVLEAYKTMDLDKNYVVTDVRFLNEAEWVNTFSGQIWRVERPNVTAVNLHVSESELDGYVFDSVILNDGTLEDLKDKVASALGSK
jgi:dephospho-CoA kinase